MTDCPHAFAEESFICSLFLFGEMNTREDMQWYLSGYICYIWNDGWSCQGRFCSALFPNISVVCILLIYFEVLTFIIGADGWILKRCTHIGVIDFYEPSVYPYSHSQLTNADTVNNQLVPIVYNVIPHQRAGALVQEGVMRLLHSTLSFRFYLLFKYPPYLVWCLLNHAECSYCWQNS